MTNNKATTAKPDSGKQQKRNLPQKEFKHRLLRAKYVRLVSQGTLLVLLNFTVIGSLYVSPVLPILRFPKLFDIPGLGEGVPLCTAGSLERTLTTFWPFMLIILVLGFLFLICILIGRALCGWACPIGLIQDSVTRLLKRLKINTLEPPRKVHNKLRFIKYALLFLIIALSASFGIAILIDAPMGEMYRGLCDPMAQASPICLGCPTPILRYMLIDVGYNFNPNLDNPSNIFQISIFLMFIIGIFVVPRFWCRYLCPIGALSSLFNKVSLLHLNKDQSKCTRCNYCADVCPTKVESIVEESEATRIGDTSCTYCLECVEICPEKALSVKFGSQTLYRGGKDWWEEKKKGGKNN
jgi:polyferredoxin